MSTRATVNTGAATIAQRSQERWALDALATALAASRHERLSAVDPEAASEVLRLAFPERDAKTWWPSVPGRSTASTTTGFYET